MADSSQMRILGRMMVISCTIGKLVVVKSNSSCADPTALWTGEGLGWGWLGCCLLFLPLVSFLCAFMPLCLKPTTGFSHWWAPIFSVWGLLLAWLMADSHLCKLSLRLVSVTLSLSTMITLFFLELTEEDCFWHVYVFHPWDMASPAQLHLKQDGLYSRQDGFLEDFFVWYIILPFDAKVGAQAALMKPSK